MEVSDNTHEFSCDLNPRSRGYHVTDAARMLQRRGGSSARRRFRCDGSGLDTPLVQWKFSGAVAGAPAGGVGRIRRVRGAGVAVEVSARKLAAGMWHLAAVLNSGRGSGGGKTSHWQHGRFDRLHFGVCF